MSYTKITISTEELEQELGRRVRILRIRKRLDQAELAKAANLSVGAVKNLEGGKGSSLKSFIKVLRALDCIDVLDSLESGVSISPLQVAQSAARRMPQRVYKKRKR